jgi:hypothetical protein
MTRQEADLRRFSLIAGMGHGALLRIRDLIDNGESGAVRAYVGDVLSMIEPMVFEVTSADFAVGEAQGGQPTALERWARSTLPGPGGDV